MKRVVAKFTKGGFYDEAKKLGFADPKDNADVKKELEKLYRRLFRKYSYLFV